MYEWRKFAAVGGLVALRLYGPLEPWFDKSWKAVDIELVD
jgi:hypothetical protein